MTVTSNRLNIAVHAVASSTQQSNIHKYKYMMLILFTLNILNYSERNYKYEKHTICAWNLFGLKLKMSTWCK